MNFSSAHNDYLDPDRHAEQEPSPQDIKRRNAGRRILREFGADNWGKVYRSLYKGTDCGVSVGVSFNGGDEPVYCEELYKFGKDCWPVQLYVSSIVEGVERTTDTQVVDLLAPHALKRLRAACDAVEKEADEIWRATHGCPGCAKLHGFHDDDGIPCEGDDGVTPVHPKCKKCGGHGSCI